MTDAAATPDETHARRIERIYAWIATERDGGQGIPAFRMDDGILIQLVGADLERVESLWPYALGCLEICSRVELVEFSERKVLMTHSRMAPKAKAS